MRKSGSGDALVVLYRIVRTSEGLFGDLGDFLLGGKACDSGRGLGAIPRVGGAAAGLDTGLRVTLGLTCSSVAENRVAHFGVSDCVSSDTGAQSTVKVIAWVEDQAREPGIAGAPVMP